MQKRPPISDPKEIGQLLTSMKKQMSQIEGEMTMMKNDGISSLFNNIAEIMNDLWTQKTQLETKLKEVEATLEKIYQGHPDIKISIEAEKKEAQKPKKK